LLGSLVSWKVSHVRREGNMVAHSLAKLALSKQCNRVWINSCPSELLYAVNADIYYWKLMFPFKKIKKKKKKIKIKRRQQGSNLRGRSPTDFKSVSLTTRTYRRLCQRSIYIFVLLNIWILYWVLACYSFALKML
jgi:hypothetical protein